MLRRTITAVTALCIVGALACSLTSLDGLSDGATSGPPLAEGGTSDASVDGAVVDAPSGTDATADGGSFCASAPAGAFCDDFESGLAKWQVDASGSGNSLVIDDATSVSASHSAFSTVAGDGASCLTRVFPGSPTILEVDADVKFESSVVSGLGYDFFKLNGSDNHNLALQLRGGVVEFDEDIVPVTDGGQGEIDTSTNHGIDSGWHHVRWTNHLSASKADVEVLVDGAKVGSYTANALDFAAPVTFELGDCTTSPGSTPWKVHFDNVVIVLK